MSGQSRSPKRTPKTKLTPQKKKLVPEKPLEALPADPRLGEESREAGPSRKTLVAQYHREVTSGPLPKASEYKLYEETLAGSAHRILKLSEDEAEDRRKKGDRIIGIQGTALSRGQWMSFIVILVCIGCMTACILLDKPVGAISSGIVALGSLVTGLRASMNQLVSNDSKKKTDDEDE